MPRGGLCARPFWFLRHGETDWNAATLAQGSTDVPLNATGLAQARRAAAVLAGRGVASLVASPLARARVTAEVVAAVLGLPVSLDADLREANFGAEEGRPMTDWFGRWIAGEETPAGAEPFLALRQRAVAAINRALALRQPVLVVAHGGLFRALRAEMGLAPEWRTPNATPLFCRPEAARAPWSVIPVASE